MLGISFMWGMSCVVKIYKQFIFSSLGFREKWMLNIQILDSWAYSLEQGNVWHWMERAYKVRKEDSWSLGIPPLESKFRMLWCYREKKRKECDNYILSSLKEINFNGMMVIDTNITGLNSQWKISDSEYRPLCPRSSLKKCREIGSRSDNMRDHGVRLTQW